MYIRGAVFLLCAFGFFSSPFSTYLRLYLHRMSWDSYINNMTGTDGKGDVQIKFAVICGKNPPGVWATSPGINVTPEQIKVLCGDGSNFGQCSPTIGPYKCRMLRNNKDTDGLWCIDFKSAADAEGNAYNVCVGYTNSAIVVGIGTKEANGGQVSAQVFRNVSYLRQNGM